MTRPSDLGVSIGETFQGRYEIVALLGEGGFGTVYKARQLATDQAVAVKVLRLDGISAASIEKRLARFRREMCLCGQLHHPNIVRLIDFGEAEEGGLYSVFEFVPGKNLATVLAEEGALQPAEARHLMLEVLDALSCAHAQGVVHRDLKPSNIMVVPTGARRNALVLDFGIGALLKGARQEDYVSVTGTNEVVGTPMYSAPEQLRGAEPTPRTDLYAWGLVFLECLTGRRAISGSWLHEIVVEQVGPGPIPIPAALRDHPLGEILRRATVKDVAARDVTAEGLLRELEVCALKGLRREALCSSPRTSAPAASSKSAAVVATTATVARSDFGGVRSTISMDSATGKVSAEGATADGGRLSEGERRTLTAVCCALSARSVTLGAADPEEIDDLLQVQQATCGEMARRFQGHVASALGDQVLLYFGHPNAREDDASRAAQAALKIAAEIKQHGALLAIERGVSIEVRIGIYTGPMVRDVRQTADATLAPILGTTPKLAARLAALAPPGVVVTSGETYRLLRDQFTLVSEGMHALAPSTPPVEIYQLREGDSAE